MPTINATDDLPPSWLVVSTARNGALVYKVVAVDVRPIGEQSTMTPALAGAAGS